MQDRKIVVFDVKLFTKYFVVSWNVANNFLDSRHRIHEDASSTRCYNLNHANYNKILCLLILKIKNANITKNWTALSIVNVKNVLFPWYLLLIIIDLRFVFIIVIERYF